MASEILNLPPEVKLKILDNLPIKNVETLRCICKDFKSLVDLNKIKIAIPVITRETKRLTDYAADRVFYPDDLSCIDALMRGASTKVTGNVRNARECYMPWRFITSSVDQTQVSEICIKSLKPLLQLSSTMKSFTLHWLTFSTWSALQQLI